MATAGDEGLCTQVSAPRRYEADRIKGQTRREILRKKILWFFTGRRHEPAPSYFGVVESVSQGRIGICCSGGGIRSASFNLGALQAMSEAHQLKRADYLAAVSGGSYIAAGMAMIADTGQEGSHSKLLETSGPQVSTGPPFYRGSPEEQYLRNRSSYLAPTMTAKLGLIYRVVLGLIFQLLFLSALLAPIGFLVGLLYRDTFPGLTRRGAEGSIFCLQPATNCDFAATPVTWTQTVIVGTLAVCLLLGLASIVVRFPNDRWRAGVQLTSMVGLVIPLLVSLFVIWLPATLAALRNLEGVDDRSGVVASQLTAVGAAGGTSLAAVLLGILLQLRARVEGPRAVLESAGVIRQQYAKLSSRLRTSFIYLAGAVAGPVLLYAIVVAAALFTVRAEDIGALAWALVAGALVLFLLVYVSADLTTWSLHPFYRRRLATAFALRRVEGDPAVDGPAGKAVERRYESLPSLSAARSPSGADKPTLIVCAAANISNPGATPPGRGVTSLTFSSKSIGGPLVGAVATSEYLERFRDQKRRKDFTLMAAVAMSGAALSPSMGKETRRPLTFLMALANIRLGVWIPNPRRIHEWQSKWRPRPSYLLRELLGWNTINAKYLYVTDGGHYENLGLVELLRRGCTHIYCFDASGGKPGTFSQLGDAIALARSEIGCEITIDPRKLIPRPDTESLAEADCVVGRIAFPDGRDGPRPDGRLVYARTVLTAQAPWDVHAFHAHDPRFPNHPTADQLYTDQKFEAYRALGHQAGENAVKLMSKEDWPPIPKQTQRTQQTQQNPQMLPTQQNGSTQQST
jgi:hypothetical protein